MTADDFLAHSGHVQGFHKVLHAKEKEKSDRRSLGPLEDGTLQGVHERGTRKLA